MQKFGLLMIGNELMQGEINDVNCKYVISELSKREFVLTHLLCCSDSIENIKKSLDFLCGVCDTIIFAVGNNSTVGDSTVQDIVEKIKKDISILSYPFTSAKIESILQQVSSQYESNQIKAISNANVLRYTDENIANYIVFEFAKRNLTLCLAESCTGGLVASELTKVPECSKVFLGSVVAYSNESKIDLLGLEPRTLERFGAVSRQVVVEMAKGVRLNIGADISVSISGVAGPSGGTKVTPVGTVWFGMSIGKKILHQKETIIKKLAAFGWEISISENETGFWSQKSIECVCEKRFNSNLSRVNIQQRALIYCLSSLANLIADL